jgi:hypothetical protein
VAGAAAFGKAQNRRPVVQIRQGESRILIIADKY